MFARSALPVLLLLMLTLSASAQKTKIKTKQRHRGAATAKVPRPQPAIKQPLPAADRPDRYLPQLQGKKVGLLVNQTSTAQGMHLADFLRRSGIRLQVIFGPEHGFRGTAPDGAKIESNIDAATGVPVVSLYGKKLKPSPEDLKGVDVLVYDIQDVGARFYTFISSLQYYLEAALENGIPLIILDRPNPNGSYVDGPVLDPKFKSFVGLQPVPIVYGMTPGEYAQMILQEGWLSEEANRAFEVTKRARYAPGVRYFRLEVIPCAGYTHKSRYVLPVRPSPNLPDDTAIEWYPSTCLFEGTAVSEGRGTPRPFATIGAPTLPKTLFAFTPGPTEGAPKPRYNGQICYGWDLSKQVPELWPRRSGRLQLRYLLEAYRLYPQKDSFFRSTFTRLAGTDALEQQIRAGKTEAEIRASWEPALGNFKAIRKKYLLYEDFE
ncbi:exo-beta-N-acetylmuramidase NamZ family protein [Flaviaesturariibacter terrae]